MRAVQVGRHGGPEVLELVERDDPTPGEGELLVEVAAAGVNYIDTYQRTGAYPTEPPFVLGMEGAGRVVSVGPGVRPTPGTFGPVTGSPGSTRRAATRSGRSCRRAARCRCRTGSTTRSRAPRCSRASPRTTCCTTPTR